MLAALDGKTERLDVNLGKTFGAAHDVGGVDSFVGRDHHHLLDIVFDALVGHVARAYDVDKHGFAGILLHQRHMFVGRRMEHDLRVKAAENVVEAVDQAYVADYGSEFEVGVIVLEFQTDVVERCLGVVEHYEFPHAELGELAAEFRTDGAGGACYHNGLSGDIGLDLVHSDLYLGASEQVVNLYLADARVGQLSVGHLVDRWRDIHLYPLLLAVFYEAAFFLAGIGLMSKEDAVEITLAAEPGYVVAVVEIVYRQSGENLVLVFGTIFQEAHDAVLPGVAQSCDQRRSLAAGTVDQHAHFLLLGVDAACDHLVEPQHKDADGHQRAKRHEEVDQHEVEYQRAGNEVVAGGHAEHHEQQDDFLDEDRETELAELAQRRVADDKAVSTGEIERENRRACGRSHPFDDELQR